MKEAIQHLRRNDPVLSEIIDRVGDYGIQFREPGFETLVRSIVYQQLSGRVASVIFARLAKAAGGQLTPANVLKLRPARMRTLGLSKQKTLYIRDLARHTRDGRVVFEELAALDDTGVIERLTRVKGIGVWTAHMFLIFALRRNDILPTGDLGIRNAMRKAYGMAEAPTPVEMEALAERWRPYCSVASWYLWRSLEGEAAL
ncbi:MAG TPA: DNA-3-methyladenine glycosylase [Bryobacteraceae bacterium]|jgi:DNA-3-methyladenine glycosylase II|nr:DNA-3-methyladenine glycosylase [Bryobacteraceae bacterium]